MTYPAKSTEELEDWFDRKIPCKHCGRRKTGYHDPCIENLPGVDYACCGHGAGPGYVAFSNGVVIRGFFDHVIKPKSGDPEETS
jgi:hypothetical protein